MSHEVLVLANVKALVLVERLAKMLVKVRFELLCDLFVLVLLTRRCRI